MKRRSFIKSIPLLGAAVVATPAILAPEKKSHHCRIKLTRSNGLDQIDKSYLSMYSNEPVKVGNIFFDGNMNEFIVVEIYPPFA